MTTAGIPAAARHSAHGGITVAAEKHMALRLPILAAAAPDTAILLLDQQAPYSLESAVHVGDRVRKHQLVARPTTAGGVPLHAPISGDVIAIEPHPGFHDQPAPAIVIRNDGRSAVIDPDLAAPHFANLSPEDLRGRIAAGGIVGLGGAAFPTYRKLTSTPDEPIRHLLLNGVECEPYIACDDALMRHTPADIVLGAQIMLHALAAEACTIAIETDKPEAMHSMQAAVSDAHDARITVVTVPAFYPAGGERQLITTLFGIEVPAGGLPRDVGYVCQNVGTAAAVARLIRDGEPLIRRVVTVTGRGVRAPRNLDSLIGTPVTQLVAECGGYTQGVERLIAGGSMMGTALPHDGYPVTKGSNCFIAATGADLRPRTTVLPCIRCGDCADVCPARLLPQQLLWHSRSGDLDELARHGLLDCIECGCCDHVCPSQIPLMSAFVVAKRDFRSYADQQRRADLSRARLHQHEERLARREAERQAKLRERRNVRDAS